MIQKHTIILWKKPDEKDKDFETIAMETYEALNVLNQFKEEYRPNFLTTYSKRKTSVFEWDYEEFKNILKKGANKEGHNVFENLGYTISFFSSKDEEKSFSYMLTVGNKNNKFNNSLVSNIPIGVNIYKKENADMISKMFEIMVQKFKPFWGCVANSIIAQNYGGFIENGRPTMVHWLNYWSDDMIKKIGKNRINRVIKRNQQILFFNNILKLQHIPLDAEKKEDLIYLKNVEKQLKL